MKTKSTTSPRLVERNNKFGICQHVTLDGVNYTVQDFRYSDDFKSWMYDLRETDGDGEMLDILERYIRVRKPRVVRTATAPRTHKRSVKKVATDSITAYAAIWLDEYDGDYGCYKVFRTQKAAVQYLAAWVFERAYNLGVPVRDNKTFKRSVKYRYVYDWLMDGHEFRLALGYDALGNPKDYVSMKVDVTVLEA